MINLKALAFVSVAAHLLAGCGGSSGTSANSADSQVMAAAPAASQAVPHQVLTATIDPSGLTNVALLDGSGAEAKALTSFDSCAVQSSADMFPDITWEVCADATYNIEVDNPSHLSSNYRVTMTFVQDAADPGVLFSCKVDGTSLTCKASGAAPVLHANPHTSVGVSN